MTDVEPRKALTSELCLLTRLRHTKVETRVFGAAVPVGGAPAHDHTLPAAPAAGQYVVGGLGSDRILFPRMRGTRIKINELNEESGQNPEI